MKYTEAFRWAFIGTGRLAGKVAREITASCRHRITAVYSRNAEKREAFAEQYGAFPAQSVEEAITREDVDGVYVVTPHTAHFSCAKQALENRKPVLCEKPVSTDADQAAELIGLSKKNGVYFSEAMWTWFSPTANKVKEWLDNGEYGEIELFDARFHMVTGQYAPRLTDPGLAGGALLDVGIYPVTYIYRLFGNPEKIECRGELQNGVDAKEEIVMRYPGGKRYSGRASIIAREREQSLILRGTKAQTLLDNHVRADEVILMRKDGTEERFEGYSGYLNEFDIVASEIREGLCESRCVPHQATLDVMKLLDECRRQMGLVFPFEK